MNILHPQQHQFTELLACFTTRHGGISSAPYDACNLAFHVGDNPEDVLKNHDLLADHLGYDRNSLVHMRQIHSDRIVIIDATHRFDTPPQCDALITNRPNTPLMVMSADCTPVLVYDTRNSAIGAIHAGRAGALNEILPKTLLAMNAEYGTTADDIIVILGPSIHGCCYEVNEEIATEAAVKGHLNALLRNEERKVFLDVNTILLNQLDSLGIRRESIELIDHCTSCRHDTYFSYRADTNHTGRIAGIIMVRSA